MANFTNKVVLVTGASAGIGESTAILFAKLGAKLAITGRNEKNLQAVAKLCEKENGLKPLTIIADLATDEGCDKTAKDTLKHFGKLDVLVNNAGVGIFTNIENTDMAAYDLVFNLNVRGVYNLTRQLVPALIETKGNIINVSSVAGTAVSVGSVTYSMTKAALNHFTRLVALELAPKGVRVNTISPGITISQFVHRMLNITDDKYKEWLRNAEKTIPMGKACTGEDIAQMIVHVTSDQSRLVTGANIEIDGAIRYGNITSLHDTP